MLYSPVDSGEEDDFRHLPAVDDGDWETGPPQTERAPPLANSPQSEAASAEQASPETEAAGGVKTKPALATPEFTTPSAEDPDAPPPADNAGELVEAKKRALLWAAGAHLALLLLLAIIQTVPPHQPLSEIIAISDSQTQQDPAWKKVAPPAPTAAGAPSIQPILSLNTSTVALPKVDFSPTASELNVGSSFGSFGAGTQGSAGGNVSFMGNQGKGSHVIFVVDVSGSMSAVAEVNGGVISRFDLLKQELIRSITKLRSNMHYQILYFSDFAWPHNEVDSTDARALERYAWNIGRGQKDARIPRFTYLQANPANIGKSKEIIEDSTNPGGTNWGAGLLMALNGSPKPDLIFFMTDGNRGDAQDWVSEVTAANGRGRRTVIHTTAMMEPDAARELNDLARRNGGKFTVVNADGSIVKSADFFKVAAD